MTTKDQERKALAQIRKIVEGLGEESYIGIAFEGCFEIAEENIENDFACSMKQRAEKAEKDKEYFHGIANTEAAEIARLEKRAEEAERLFNEKTGEASKYYASWQEAVAVANESLQADAAQGEKMRAMEDEIMRLKAKLYDMMTAGA